jgi:fatty-acyl-CoA synthase
VKERCEVNVANFLAKSARKYPNKVALIFAERRETYAELNNRVNRLANALMAHGVRRGSKVALLFNNCHEFVESLYAALKLGGVAVPLNARLSPREMINLLRHSEASALICGEEFLERAETIRQQMERIEKFIICGNRAPDPFISYEMLLQMASSEEPSSGEVDDSEDAFILYTAGTTAQPKGAVLTHQNCIWNSINYCMVQLTSFEDLSLVVFPLCHVAALGTLIAHIFIGGTSLLKKAFDPYDCLETIQRMRINRWSAVPTIYNVIVNLPDLHKYDLSSVKKLGSGAAAMPVEIKNRLAEIFPHAGITDSYGQTEAAGSITILLPEDAFRKTACVGQPLPTVEVRLVNEKDEDVPLGEVGELIYNGYNRMKGYYKDPEGTQEVLRGGWMHSGDLARMDEEGYFYIVDRKKDMIVTGGENVYSREVEEVITLHPKVAEVAVVGLPDPKWGEAVTAFVVPKAGVSLSADEIIQFCKAQIAAHKAPKSVCFLSSLPKNAVGKILKRELKGTYSSGEKRKF